MSGSNDATVRIWDSTSGNAVATFGVDEDFVSAVDFGPDSRRIASGGSGYGSIHIWDATSGREVFTIDGEEGGLGGRVVAQRRGHVSGDSAAERETESQPAGAGDEAAAADLDIEDFRFLLSGHG